MKKIAIPLARIILISIILFTGYTLYQTKVVEVNKQQEQIDIFEKRINLKDKTPNNLQEKMQGILYIPDINLNIAIYGGTSEEEIRNGVGILKNTGTLNPTPNQNVVLTSHNGDSKRDLFINLEKLTTTQYFYTKDKANNIVKYKIVEKQVVEPKDLLNTLEERTTKTPQMTLVTCTPLGINSHRLFIRGEQVEYNPTLQPIPKGKPTLSKFEKQMLVRAGIAFIMLLFTIDIKKKKGDNKSNEETN